MAYSEAELSDAIKLSQGAIPSHTGRLIYVPKDAKSADHFGGGSCVYVDYRGPRFAITCAHVTRKASRVYVLGIPSSDQPMPFGQKITEVGPVTVLKEEAAVDLAILDVNEMDFSAAQKQPYVLEDSDFIDQNFMEQRLGLLSFMCGAWGEKSFRMSLGQAKMYSETPLYFCAGPIKTVTTAAITATFAERRELFRNIKDFPQLKDVQISGGSRDLSGTSGSGLWIVGNGRVYLAGILSGPASGVAGDPEIRFTPVWQLRHALTELLASD